MFSGEIKKQKLMQPRVSLTTAAPSNKHTFRENKTGPGDGTLINDQNQKTNFTM